MYKSKTFHLLLCVSRRQINHWREKGYGSPPSLNISTFSKIYRSNEAGRDRGTSYESSRNRPVSSKMYHGPLARSRRRDHTRAIPSRSTISFFFCFRSRYRQPGRATRLRRLWEDGLLRGARYAPLETSLYDPRAQRSVETTVALFPTPLPR